MANEYALMHVFAAARDFGAMKNDVDQVGQLLTNAVKIKLSHPGSGRVYRSRMKNVGGVRTYVPGPNFHLHQASAPGEPPAVDTGAYRASWTWDTTVLPNAVILRVGSEDEIAPYLEFGTSRMAARPHIRPVVLENAGSIGPTVGAGITLRESNEARRRGGRG